MTSGKLIGRLLWAALVISFPSQNVLSIPRPRPIGSRSFKVENREYEMLVRLDEGQKHLVDRLESIEERMQHADHGRSEIHKRLNIQQEDIFVVGSIVAQQREYIKMLAATIETNNNKVTPALAQWEEVKTLGKWVSIALVAVGISGASALLFLKSWIITLLAWIKP